MAVNGEQLAKELAAKRGITIKEARETVADYWELVQGHVVDGEKVKITGVLSIETANRAERKGRNPQTGEEIVIAAHKSPKIKALTGLKTAVK